MKIKRVGLVIAPILFLILQSLPIQFISESADIVIGVALWMVIWWITEAVHIAVTALLPLVLFPLLNVAPMEAVSHSYGSPIIFLFFGGFVLALALEKVNLHKRIALSIVKITGTTPSRVILGFMIATAFMSMWISNTASTVVMLPIGISVIKLLINDADGFTKADRNFALSMMLGIAFSANSGGIATIIGTPPNSVLIALLENQYQIEISFLQWMLIGLPFSIIMVGISYFVLVKFMFPFKAIQFNESATLISKELAELGPISKGEKRVLLVFLITVLLWIFRTLITTVFPDLKLNDTIISVAAAIALFAIPLQFKKGTFVLNWSDTEKLSWGILLLFGGGLALANGMKETGVVDLITQFIAAAGFSTIIVVILLILLMIFMTELMSNVALVAVLAPVVAGIAIGLEIPMLNLLIPVTIASSCAFMLPMATPPNAIVFASGYVKVNQMVRAGVFLNVIAAILLLGYYQFILPLAF